MSSYRILSLCRFTSLCTVATRCVDRPANFESSDRDGEGAESSSTFGIQDCKWIQFRCMLVPLVVKACTQRAEGNETGCEATPAAVRLLQAEVREHLSQLLMQGRLRYKARDTEASETSTSNWLFGSGIDIKFSRPLEKQGLDWLLRLVDNELEPAKHSIQGVVAGQQPLFAGLALQVKVVGTEEWHLYQPRGGDRKKLPKRFAMRLLTMLPASSREKREAAAAAAIALLESEREKVQYAALSAAAKELWDRHAHVTVGLRMHLAGEVIKITGQGQKSRDEAHAALLRAIGATPNWQAPSPCRFRIEDGGQPSFQDSKHRTVPKQYRAQVQRIAKEWVPLPFLIVGKGGNKRCTTDKLVEVFDQLAASPSAAATAAAAPGTVVQAAAASTAAIPAQITHYRISVQRAHAGHAYMVFGLKPKPDPGKTDYGHTSSKTRQAFSAAIVRRCCFTCCRYYFASRDSHHDC